MEETEKPIRTKELVILIVIFLLFFLFRYALSYVCAKASEARENEMMELKMSTMMDIVPDVNTRRTAADRAPTFCRQTLSTARPICTAATSPTTWPG